MNTVKQHIELTDAVIFDIDDTLYLRNQPFILACQDLLADKMQLDWAELFRVRNRYSDELLYHQKETGITNEELYCLRMQFALREYGHTISPQAVRAFEERYSYYQGKISLYEGYAPFLDQLKIHHIPMAVITNGTPSRQKGKMKTLGMDQWIPEENWIVSEEAGVPKPDKKIFDLTAEKLGITDPSRLWFIGDNYPMDIEGAMRAGWNTVWFNANGDTLPEETINLANRTLHSSKELSSLLSPGF